jgi:hypothetical protein
VIDSAGRKRLSHDSFSGMLERLDLDHDELVQLLHRAGARAHVMSRVREQVFAGSDLAALSSARTRELLNCSGAVSSSARTREILNTCFLPSCNALSATRILRVGQKAGGSEEDRPPVAEDPRERLSQVASASRLMRKKLLDYARWHAQVRRELVQEGEPSHKNRFLVWTCGSGRAPKTCGGWGNRLLGIVSGLMLAIVTQRAFLIHWPDDSCVALSDYFGSEWIDWRMPQHLRSLLSPAHQAYVTSFGTRAERGWLNWNDPDTGLEMTAQTRSIDLRTFDTKPVVWLRASHGLFVDLWRNVEVAPLLCAYGFATVDDTFALLARFLLSAPKGELKRVVAQALASERLAGKFIIGLQIRLAAFTADSAPNVFIKDLSRFYAAAVAMERHLNLSHHSSVWFVATDSEEVRKTIQAGPYRDKIFYFEGPLSHLDDPYGGSRSGWVGDGGGGESNGTCSERSELKIFMDWWLLREADGLVLLDLLVQMYLLTSTKARILTAALHRSQATAAHSESRHTCCDTSRSTSDVPAPATCTPTLPSICAQS